MLNKLAQKKNIVLIICTVVLLVLWILTLIFGNAEDKVMVLVLSLILPFVIYGFARLIFKVVGRNASLKFIKFGIYFFLIFGILGVVMDVIYFITGFPNGLSPTLTACLGIIIAVLDEAKKNAKAEKEE